MTVAFVTAIYNLSTVSDADAIWARYTILSQTLPTFLVCSAKDAHRVPPNATPLFIEFDDLETAKLLRKYERLPPVRNSGKDTRDYMILMNAKAEFLKHARLHIDADHYVWIDAGIGKIFLDPRTMYAVIKTAVSQPLNPFGIFIPGCWEHNTYTLQDLTTKISWRYAGGFFIVPRTLVGLFYNTVFEGCKTIGDLTDTAVWEVNVWCFIESHLPIQWEKGDHNEKIIEGLPAYTVPVRRE
jgi:hypothetical protein